jgi:hypothetical protein
MISVVILFVFVFIGVGLREGKVERCVDCWFVNVYRCSTKLN